MRITKLVVVTAVTGTMLVAAGSASAAEPSTRETPGAPTVQLTWTARILYPVGARKKPGGRIIAKLQHYTPYTQGPAVYMVTDRKLVGKRIWIQIQLPKRPNGTKAWVLDDAVELRKTRTWIRVSTAKRTTQVFTNGKLVKTFKVAVGTGGTPTPKGLFSIYDPVPTGGQLGPYILVLTAHSNVLKTFAGGDGIVGIHGWPTSSVLGQAVSHGCVRMSRTGVRALAKYAKAGVPVQIV